MCSLANRGVHAGEALGERRVLREVVAQKGDRPFEEVDRLRAIAAAKGNLPQTLEGSCALLIAARVLERLLKQTPRLLDLVQTKRNLCLHQDRERTRHVPGCEVLLSHVEPPCELAKDLGRWGASARLDARDVRGRAAGERELALTQTLPLTRLAQACPGCDRVITCIGLFRGKVNSFLY